MSKLEKPKMRLVIKTPVEILRDRKVTELLKSMSGETQSGSAINLRLPDGLKKKITAIAKKYKMPYGLIIRAITEEFINLDDQDRSLFLAGRLKSKPTEKGKTKSANRPEMEDAEDTDEEESAFQMPKTGTPILERKRKSRGQKTGVPKPDKGGRVT